MPQSQPDLVCLDDEIELELSPAEDVLMRELLRYYEQSDPAWVLRQAWTLKAEQTIGRVKYNRWKRWIPEDQLPPIPAGLQKCLDELEDDEDDG